MTRIHCVVTGLARAKAGERGVRRYLSDRWSDEAVPVNSFLVEDSAGLYLFDAGQTARAAEPGWFPRWHPFFRLSRFELGAEDEIAPQLRRVGFEPEAVRRIVLSHLHTDHVGGLDAFPGAEVVVGREEWKRATGVGGRIRGYLPQYWPAGLRPLLVDLDGPPLGPFPGTYDLTGAGRLLLLPTPGHTRGHVGLLVRDGERAWLLAGDLAHTAAEVELVAPMIGAWARREGVALLTSHDPAAAAIAAG